MTNSLKSLFFISIASGLVSFIGSCLLPLSSHSVELVKRVKNDANFSPMYLISQNITSVSQFSDVNKSDPAFTALQSLVERYGCVAGYPDGTFRGQESLTRYALAMYLNACLDKINEIISAGLADKTTKADLVILQKLQEEFAAELATVRGRLSAIDARLTKLESQKQVVTVDNNTPKNQIDYTIVTLVVIFGVITLIIVFRVTSR
jgi:hypothetical protein